MKTDFSPRRIDVESVDQVPNEFELSFSVKVVTPAATRSEPPRIQIGLSNERSSTQEYRNGITKVFGGRVSTGNLPRLILLEPGYPVQLSDVPLRPAPGTIAFDMPFVTTRLEPSETKTVTYDVWDGNDEGEPFPSKCYRFEDTYERTQNVADARGQFTWGFSLKVSRD